MGWKAVKEHYRIDHAVQVTEAGICIGSPYIHNIIVIDQEGAIVKDDDRTLNDKLMGYQAEMKADPETLRRLTCQKDTFEASIPVYTYRGAEIIKKYCEQPGWPNVTHDGDMMYENTFFAERKQAVEAAKRNCEAAIMLGRMELADKQERLKQVRARLDQLLSDARALGIKLPDEGQQSARITSGTSE